MTDTAIRAENLAVRLGQHQALSGVDLEIAAGSYVVVAGPNGAGTSTLLRAILGIVPYTGKLLVNGQPPGQQSPRSIGYVPQIKTLDRSFPATAADLVVSGLSGGWPWRLTGRMHRQAGRALERTGGRGLADRQLKNLSGGELQRVYLARATASRPEIILLDEPATGIDMVGEQDMFAILDEYHAESGVTILMVTHDALAAHHHASHVLLLNEQVVAYGPGKEALSEENISRAFGHAGHYHVAAERGRHG